MFCLEKWRKRMTNTDSRICFFCFWNWHLRWYLKNMNKLAKISNLCRERCFCVWYDFNFYQRTYIQKCREMDWNQQSTSAASFQKILFQLGVMLSNFYKFICKYNFSSYSYSKINVFLWKLVLFPCIFFYLLFTSPGGE